MLNRETAKPEGKRVDLPWAWIKCVKDLTMNNDLISIPSLPVELLPWLFLSDGSSVRDVFKLKNLGVTHVLSLNGMPEAHAEELAELVQGAGLVHKMVGAEDSEGYDLIGKHWQECHKFMKEAKESGGRIVVHCAAGINRSGLIACAAHMVLERVNVLHVVRHCVDRRGTVLWNESFQKQLCILAAKEGLLGDKPKGYSDEMISEIPLRPPPIHKALERLF